MHLARHPLCAECQAAATIVDHVTPHRGDPNLFWDAANWQSLCKRCHDRKTATQDAERDHRGRFATTATVLADTRLFRAGGPTGRGDQSLGPARPGAPRGARARGREIRGGGWR